MKTLKNISLFLFALFAITSLAHADIKILSVEGNASAGNAPIQANQVLPEGISISTGAKSSVSAQAMDGTTFSLGAASNLLVSTSSNASGQIRTVLELKSGQIDVTSQKQTDSYFVVKTPHSSIVSKKATFTAVVNDNSSSVSVQEGTVTTQPTTTTAINDAVLAGALNISSTVKAGEEATVTTSAATSTLTVSKDDQTISSVEMVQNNSTTTVTTVDQSGDKKVSTIETTTSTNEDGQAVTTSKVTTTAADGSTSQTDVVSTSNADGSTTINTVVDGTVTSSQTVDAGSTSEDANAQNEADSTTTPDTSNPLIDSSADADSGNNDDNTALTTGQK